MKALNNVVLSVFCKEEEDEKSIYACLLKLLPFDLDKEKIKIERRSALGFNERKIVIYEARLEKERHTKEFTSKLLGNLKPEQKALLLRQVESRLDEEFNFFIRLDKPRFLEGEYFITDHGDCYHIRMCVAAFPKKREKALEVLKRVIS